MNHVSGYPDCYPLDFLDRRMLAPFAGDELLHQYAGGKLDFEPGSKYSYSNTGFILIGHAAQAQQRTGRLNNSSPRRIDGTTPLSLLRMSFDAVVAGEKVNQHHADRAGERSPE